MSTNPRQNIDDVFREGTLIDQAMEAAERDAIVRHKQSGQPIPVWRDGKTTLVSAGEWLRGRSGKEVLLSQAGAFEDDAEDLEELRATIHRDRGRPEVEEGE